MEKHKNIPMIFEHLNASHSNRLLEFEKINQLFFESFIAPREAGFYTSIGIAQHIAHLKHLKQQKLGFSFVLIEGNSIIARANIKNITSNGDAEIGYRVALASSQRGVASACVEHLIHYSTEAKLKHLCAYVMDNNPASEKVLNKNGFILQQCLPKAFTHKGRVLNGFKYTKSLI